MEVDLNEEMDENAIVLHKELSKKVDPLEQQKEEVVVEPWEIHTDKHMTDLKYLMSKRIGIPFNTNVLRIALNKEEEMVAG